MNTFVLMAEIFTDPELRYTPDNQNAIASFLAQFPNSRPDESPYRIKVTGWNNLANEIMEKHHKGDQVLIEGRLNINTIDRGGYKEKRAELTAQRIHALGSSANFSSSSSASSSSSDFGASTYSSKPSSNVVPIASKSVPTASPPPIGADPTFDDIPF